MGVQIYVEGKADQRFIEDYLIHIGKIVPKSTVNQCNGNGLTEPLAAKIKEEHKAGNKIIIIFDADSNRLTSLSNIQRKLPSLSGADIFLFPNNHDTGTLENLLLKLIPTPKSDILNCFESLIQCFRGTISAKNNELTLPDNKIKLYTYTSIHTGEKANETARNYLNPNLWDLNNSYLDPLKTFLDSNIP